MIVWLLMGANLRNSYRKHFNNRIIVGNLLLSMLLAYTIFALLKASELLKSTLLNNGSEINVFAFYLILSLIVLDLIFKLLFPVTKDFVVTPFLRFNIQRKDIAQFIIFYNQLNLINLFGILLLIPVSVLLNGSMEPLVLWLLNLFLLAAFLLNGYISMMLNTLKLRKYFFVLLPVFILIGQFLWGLQSKTNHYIPLVEINAVQIAFSISMVFLLLVLLHLALRNKIMKKLNFF